MTPLDAFLYGALIGAMIDAAALGLVNCQAYKDWKAEQEQKQEPAVVRTFGDPAALASADASDAPDIVIVTD
ncbi:MAG: hypothetical protein IJK52_01910 [Oscillospiraceae bacterium]|nr:hypothetical protein [Oscillospiraceae bacterium]